MSRRPLQPTVALLLGVVLAVAACGQVGTPLVPVSEVLVATAAPSASESAGVAFFPRPSGSSAAQRFASLSHAGVIVIHTTATRDRAKLVSIRLQRFGAEARLRQVSDTGNDEHRGKLYIKPGGEELGPTIREIVRDLVTLEEGSTDPGGDPEQYFLWVVE